jgi:hypothetical protein
VSIARHTWSCERGCTVRGWRPRRDAVMQQGSRGGGGAGMSTARMPGTRAAVMAASARSQSGVGMAALALT